MEITEQDMQRLGQIITTIYNRINTTNYRLAAIKKIMAVMIVFCLITLCLQIAILITAFKTPDIKAELDEYFDNPTEIAQLEENFEFYED